jgi:hypothetical protein
VAPLWAHLGVGSWAPLGHLARKHALAKHFMPRRAAAPVPSAYELSQQVSAATLGKRATPTLRYCRWSLLKVSDDTKTGRTCEGNQRSSVAIKRQTACNHRGRTCEVAKKMP